MRVLKSMPWTVVDVIDEVLTTRAFLSALDWAPASRTGRRSWVKYTCPTTLTPN